MMYQHKLITDFVIITAIIENITTIMGLQLKQKNRILFRKFTFIQRNSHRNTLIQQNLRANKYFLKKERSYKADKKYFYSYRYKFKRKMNKHKYIPDDKKNTFVKLDQLTTSQFPSFWKQIRFRWQEPIKKQNNRILSYCNLIVQMYIVCYISLKSNQF